jgi:hypothetical protein
MSVLVVAVRVAAVWGTGALAAAGAADAGAVPAVPVAVPFAGSRGKAIVVPGLGALNRAGRRWFIGVVAPFVAAERGAGGA